MTTSAKWFVGLIVFLELVVFIGKSILVMEDDYPRVLPTYRWEDTLQAFIGAALAYWGMTLLSP